MRGMRSLKEHATVHIAQKFMHYLKNETKLKTLPTCLLELILSKLTQIKCIDPRDRQGNETMDKIINALTLSISRETKAFEFNHILSYGSADSVLENADKILETIAEKAKKLQHLSVNQDLINIDYDKSLNSRSITAICRMKNLTKLEISSIMIKYASLESICDELTKLVYLDVKLDFSGTHLREKWKRRDVIEKFKSTFSRLKVFLFRPYFSNCEESLKLTSLCMEHLTKLELILETEFTCPCCTIKEPPLPADTSSLRRLSTVLCDWDLHLYYPNVTDLKVGWPYFEKDQRKLNSVLRFSKIESLHLYNLPSISMFNKISAAYGANLHSLTLDSAGVDFKLSTVFAAFPNLSKLALNYVTFEDEDDEQIQYSYAKLIELKWILCCVCDDSDPIFKVSKILSAPNLERVSLKRCHRLDVKDLKKLTSLIESKQVLGKLSKLSLEFTDTCKDGVNVEFLKAFKDFIQKSSAFLPKLLNLKLRARAFHPRADAEDRNNPQLAFPLRQSSLHTREFWFQIKTGTQHENV
ncbi:Hypothetical predicted protein [Cloeon dipterum]|uniref:Uncharacterized protein n=1 Tax=Cloeon dipterum TaxID=197152 RepID=A0A8S1DS95_9INSE|nr:Hypothetical predicted protein [Cloeon dipterum]